MIKKQFNVLFKDDTHETIDTYSNGSKDDAFKAAFTARWPISKFSEVLIWDTASKKRLTRADYVTMTEKFNEYKRQMKKRGL